MSVALADLRVACLEVGPLATNCYLVTKKDNARALIIDPGADAELIRSTLVKEQLEPEAILLTHGHFDHLGASVELLEEFAIPIYLHAGDAELVQLSPQVALEWTGAPVRLPAEFADMPQGEWKITGLDMQIVHTPGHSPGSVSLLVEGAAWVGDLLFYESVGRWDFPGGDRDALLHSIREQLLVLPDDTVVYPGHGPSTTIGHERRANPYL